METHGAAVLGFLAILGVPLVGLLALVLGIVALVRINRSGGALKGRGLAIGAIVIGALMMLASLLAIPLLLFASNAKVAVRAESSKVAVERAERAMAEEAARRAEEAVRKREPEHPAPTPPPPPPVPPVPSAPDSGAR